jgi:hypothetical protein
MMFIPSPATLIDARSIGTFRQMQGFSTKSRVEETPMAYNGQSRHPSAADTRRSSSDDVVVPLLVTIVITAFVLAGIYFFAWGTANVADTSVGPAVTQLTEPSQPTPQTQRESRPTQAPIP